MLGEHSLQNVALPADCSLGRAPKTNATEIYLSHGIAACVRLSFTCSIAAVLIVFGALIPVCGQNGYLEGRQLRGGGGNDDGDDGMEVR